MSDMTASPNSITMKDNRISFTRDMSATPVRNLLGSLRSVIDAGHKDIVLDFSGVERIFERFMLPTLPIIVNYREQKIDFTLILPKKLDIARLFRNTNWAHFIQQSKFKKSGKPTELHVPASRFSNSDEAETIVDEISNVILSLLPGLERKQTKAIEWALHEITDNVLNHANSSPGGFVQATTYAKEKCVEFVVADAGIGIPTSLSMSDQEQALKYAIESNATRDRSANQGNGLYGSHRIAALSGGFFEISSYNAFLRVEGNENPFTKREEIMHEGTSVTCRIDISRPDLLDKALLFNGRIHDPVFDYIERRYEKDEGILFILRKECSSFGSRESGRMALNKIENLLRVEKSRPFIIDCKGVDLISSSFADEVFGRLATKFGTMRFMDNFEFRNLDSTVSNLIDRAIIQRSSTDMLQRMDEDNRSS